MSSRSTARTVHTQCPRCNGTGLVYNKMLAVFTVGIAPAISWLLGDSSNKNDYDDCPRCEGMKFIISSYESLEKP